MDHRGSDRGVIALDPPRDPTEEPRRALAGSWLALKALGEPRRLEILRVLRAGPRAVGEIAAEVDISQQAASQHLAVLGKAGFVDARKEGTRHLYALRPDGFAPVAAFVESFWGPRLAALKDEVESVQTGAGRAS